MLKIHSPLIESIAQQGKDELPNEACGYLAGLEKDKLDIAYAMTNIDASPDHFSLDPKEQFQVLEKARDQGRTLQVVYHTHPETPARMSEEDLRLARDPNIYYLIYSLLNLEARVFRLNSSKEIEEVNFETYS